MIQGARIIAVIRERQEDGGLRVQAVVAEVEGTVTFIPARLPCGECGPCRRGRVSGCSRIRSWADAATPGATVPADVPGRFTYAVAEGISPELALWAVVVSPFLEAMGRAGLGAGDLSLWIGTNPMALLGACVAAAHGSQSLLLGPNALERTMGHLPVDDGAARPRFLPWHTLDAASLAALIETPGGLVEKQVYVVSDEAMAWTAAAQLLSFGTTLVGFGATPALAGLPGDTIAITVGAQGNPDFVPEAMATLAKNSDVRAVCRLLTVAGAYDVLVEPTS